MVRADADGAVRPLSEGVSIRSRVNEYGGGAMCLVPGVAGAFAYVDQADQRVWFCDGPATTRRGRRRSAAGRGVTAARDGEVHDHGGLSATADGDWVLAVREVHAGAARPARSVVALSTPDRAAVRDHAARGVRLLRHAACDPDGDRFAVVAWDHPDMPWDASGVLVLHSAGAPVRCTGTRRLWAAGPAQQVAGGDRGIGRPAGLGQRGLPALRLGSARLVATVPASRGGGGAHGADDGWRQSSTGRIGCSASRPWPSGRRRRSWPA